MYIIFHISPWIPASEGRSFTTQEHQNPCPILLEFRHSSPPLCKNDKKPEVDKKIQACDTLTLTESFVVSSCRYAQNSQYFVY